MQTAIWLRAGLRELKEMVKGNYAVNLGDRNIEGVRHFKSGLTRDVTEFFLYAMQDHDQVAGFFAPFFNEGIDFRGKHFFLFQQ